MDSQCKDLGSSKLFQTIRQNMYQRYVLKVSTVGAELLNMGENPGPLAAEENLMVELVSRYQDQRLHTLQTYWQMQTELCDNFLSALAVAENEARIQELCSEFVTRVESYETSLDGHLLANVTFARVHQDLLRMARASAPNITRRAAIQLRDMADTPYSSEDFDQDRPEDEVD
ncbi:MAG: hypothetical protein M1822_000183 [Bathelium mastoideum]|nr:MAG: hypothetical protein M1822_000183 [Bathelium mastoideum]